MPIYLGSSRVGWLNFVDVETLALHQLIDGTIQYYDNARLTTIDDYAFVGCSSLSLISCSYATYIGESAFYECSNLRTANIPLATEVGIRAFENCINLTSISDPKLSIINSYAFRSCRALSYFSFRSVTQISGWEAFAHCVALTSISLTNTSLSYLGSGTFSGCVKLSYVNASYVTSLGSSVFSGCSSLTSISFPRLQTIGKNAFGYGLNIASSVVFYFPEVTRVEEDAFNYTRLGGISLPKVTFIGSDAFYGNNYLLSVYLNNITSVPTLQTSYAFYSTPIGGYSGVTGRYGSVYVPASLYNAFKTAPEWSKISARIASV